MSDVVFLVADGQMRAVLQAFFERGAVGARLQCGPFEIVPSRDIVSFPRYSDGGIHRSAHELLRTFLSTHQRAVVILDQQFGGELPADVVRTEILENLKRNGWEDRCEVIVITPELESWLWQDNPNVDQALRHAGDLRLREALMQTGEWPDGHPKPIDPKRTILRLIRQNRAGVPIAVYTEIAGSVRVDGCVDAGFQTLLASLRAWSPLQ